MRKLLPLLLLAVTGCAFGPKYPESPENGVHVSRGPFGLVVDVTNKADTDVAMKDCHFNADTKQMDIGEVTFTSSQSKNQAVLLEWMREYTTQQKNANATVTELNSQNWQGITQVASTVAPLVGQFLTGSLRGQEAKILRPTLIEQAVALAGSGKADPIELLKALRSRSPDVAAEVRAKLVENEIIPASPTTQPTTTRPAVQP